jgi:hypothetical protein
MILFGGGGTLSSGIAPKKEHNNSTKGSIQKIKENKKQKRKSLEKKKIGKNTHTTTHKNTYHIEQHFVQSIYITTFL